MVERFKEGSAEVVQRCRGAEVERYIGIVPSWREQNQSFKHYFSTRLIVARLYMGISKNKVHQSIPRRI